MSEGVTRAAKQLIEFRRGPEQARDVIDGVNPVSQLTQQLQQLALAELTVRIVAWLHGVGSRAGRRRWVEAPAI